MRLYSQVESAIAFSIVPDDAILILEVFNKTTKSTSSNVIENCKKRLGKYDNNAQRLNVMDEAKRKRLEEKGWIGTVADFLERAYF